MKNVSGNKRIKVCTVGTGKHMNEILVPCLRLLNEIELQVACSKSMDHAVAFAERWGYIRCSDDWRECLKSPDVDAIVVSGPPKLHYEVLEAAIKAGKSAFVEKPVVSTLADLNTLIKLASTSRSTIQVGYNLRYAPAVQVVNQVLAQNSKIDCVHINYFANKPRVNLWGLDNICLSACLAIGVHPLNLATHLLGPVQSILNTNVEINGDDLDICVDMLHTRGRISKVRFNNMAHKFEIGLEGYSNDQLALKLNNLRSVLAIKENGTDEIFRYSELRGGFEYNGYIPQLKTFFSDVVDLSKTDRQLDLDNSHWMYELFERLKPVHR